MSSLDTERRVNPKPVSELEQLAIEAKKSGYLECIDDVVTILAELSGTHHTADNHELLVELTNRIRGLQP